MRRVSETRPSCNKTRRRNETESTRVVPNRKQNIQQSRWNRDPERPLNESPIRTVATENKNLPKGNETEEFQKIK